MAQRQVVSDLGGEPTIQPAAQGRDSYHRPDAVSVGHPAPTNSMMQLSQALSAFEPKLLSFYGTKQAQHSEEEVAQAKDYFHGELRGAFNKKIDEGALPPGASPFFVRAVKRQQLEQLGGAFHQELQLAYQGEDGAAARNSDDPRVLNQFMDGQRQKFAEQYMNGESSTAFDKLDVGEVFYPLAERSYKQLQAQHVSDRIKDNEQKMVETVGARITGQLDAVSSTFPQFDQDHGVAALKRTAAFISDVGYNNDNGAVKNGLDAHKFGDTAVDMTVAQAVKNRDPWVLGSLQYVVNKNGIRLSDTPYGKAKIQAAQEHIATLSHQEDVIARYNKNKPLMEMQDKQAIDALKWAKDAADRAAKNYQDSQDDRSAKAHINTLKNVAFIALEANDKGSVDAALKQIRTYGIDGSDAAITLEKQIGEITKLRHEVTPSTTHDLDYAQIDTSMHSDPMDYDRGRLVTALGQNKISLPEYTHFTGLLTQLQKEGDNPYMTSPQFKSAITAVTNVIGRDPYDPANMLGQLEVPKALHDLRSEARAWLDKNQGASPAAFDAHMAEVTPKIAERHSKEVETQLKQQADQQKAEQEAKQQVLDHAKKIEEARNKVIEKATKDQERRTEVFGEQPSKPSKAAFDALAKDPSPENIDAFKKKFGPDAEITKKTETLPNSKLEAKQATTSGRYFVDNGEIVDLKGGQIVSAGQFNRNATKQEKDEVERLLRESGSLDE